MPNLQLLSRLRNFYLASLLCLFGAHLSAQEQPASVPKTDKKTNVGVIIGNALSAENSQAVAFASVKLIPFTDTTKAIQEVTDKNGSFSFEKVSFGLYKLSIAAVGFNTLLLDSINVREERYDFNLGDLKLNSSASPLTDVVIYAEKPLIENKDGNIVYNVGESALSNGSSTAELLRSMPLVNTDPNGKILLRGKEPKILIDDKPVELSAQQLQDLLESLPGGSIERVELLLNPPAQYATEEGGVINIVTKKGKIGWVGRVTATVGTRGEANTAANVSYRNKKLSFTSIAGFAANRVTGNSYSHRQNIYTDSSNYLYTDGNYVNKNTRPTLRLQLDYEKDKQNLYSVVYQGNWNNYDNNSTTAYSNLNNAMQTYKMSTRNTANNGNGSSNSLTGSYTHKGKNPQELLRVIAIASMSKGMSGRNYFQQYLNPDYTPTGVDSTQQQDGDNNSNTYSVNVSYDKPLPFLLPGTSFSTGSVFTQNNYHNILTTNFLKKPERVMVESDLLSNNFKFHQSVFTIRAGFTFMLPDKWKIVAGAQAENTHLDFQFLRTATLPVDNNYWNLLPNIMLRKEFDKTFNTSLVYRASIRRPGIDELNPSINYNDPYNIRYGNPYLDAQLADNFDWNISFIKGKYYINGNLGYNKIKDVFNTIRTLVSDGKTETTWKNISDKQQYESSIWGGYTFNKNLRMNTSIGYTYNVYDETGKQLYKYRDGGSFFTSLNAHYTPTPLLTFDGNARFSSFADPQGRSKSNLQMNFGIQHKFMDKRLVIGINIIDPILTQKYTTYTYGPNFFLENYSSTNTRNFRLTVSYQLNRLVQKKQLSDKEKKKILDKLKNKS